MSIQSPHRYLLVWYYPEPPWLDLMKEEQRSKLFMDLYLAHVCSYDPSCNIHQWLMFCIGVVDTRGLSPEILAFIEKGSGEDYELRILARYSRVPGIKEYKKHVVRMITTKVKNREVFNLQNEYWLGASHYEHQWLL